MHGIAFNYKFNVNECNQVIRTCEIYFVQQYLSDVVCEAGLELSPEAGLELSPEAGLELSPQRTSQLLGERLLRAAKADYCEVHVSIPQHVIYEMLCLANTFNNLLNMFCKNQTIS